MAGSTAESDTGTSTMIPTNERIPDYISMDRVGMYSPICEIMYHDNGRVVSVMI